MNALEDIGALLGTHGISDVREQPLAHAGFSGATLTRLVRGDGEQFVLKRMSLGQDWIMRATDDSACREFQFAAADPHLGSSLRTPMVGVARDGEGYALLMHDITADVLPAGLVDPDRLDRILGGMAALHESSALPQIAWCTLAQRLGLLTPAGAAVASAYSAPVAGDIIHGWQLFAELAPRRVAELVAHLFEDLSPLLAALERLPSAFLHGDLKFDNIGISPDGRIWMIDWALLMHAPRAVDLGWFLAINSKRISMPLDDVMAKYAAIAHISRQVHAAHDHLTILCGLVLRGWRKALDADAGEPDELRWWCERAEAAAELL